MTDLTLIQREGLEISFTPDALALRAKALLLSGGIESVASESAQQTAVEAQTACSQLLKAVEAARTTIKKPVIEAGRKIDSAAKSFVEKVAQEELRIAKLLGDYQAALLAKTKSETAAAMAELSELERTREQQLAECTTLEEREQVQADYNDIAREIQTTLPPLPAKAEGQTLRHEWQFEVKNPFLLASTHPSFVTIEPKRREIKEALALGVKVQGVRAWQEVKSGVRIEKEKAIEV